MTADNPLLIKHIKSCNDPKPSIIKYCDAFGIDHTNAYLARKLGSKNTSAVLLNIMHPAMAYINDETEEQGRHRVGKYYLKSGRAN